MVLLRALGVGNIRCDNHGGAEAQGENTVSIPGYVA
jgi:hypothetical protein